MTKQLISALQVPEKEQSRTIPKALRATCLKLIHTMFPKQPYLWYLITQCLPKKGVFLTFYYVAAQKYYG